MKKESIWLQNREKKQFSKLTKDEKTDVLIIGGGLTGLSLAYFLKDSNLKVTIIEQNEIGRGMTGHTTGKLTYLQDIVYQDITKAYDEDTAYKYYLSQKEAIKLVQKIIKQNKIACDYELVPSILFATTKKEIEKIKKEETFFTNYHIPYEKISKLKIDFPCLYGIKVNDTAVFNPIKYLDALANIVSKANTKIYEHTKAVKIDGTTVITDNHKINAKKIVFASHYPFPIFLGMIPFKSHIENSYIIASAVKENAKFSAITASKPTYSLRYSKMNDIYRLLAGNSHKTSKDQDYKKKYDELLKAHQKFFQEPVSFVWHAHDLMTPDHMPYIGEVTKDIYMATGYNKWGMTNATIAGKIMADLILDKKNRYESLFSFKRKFSLTRMGKITTDIFEEGKVYLKTKMMENSESKHVTIQKINGIKVGIYKENGKEYKVLTKCPHTGCNLIFNAFDKTWDCPCHGSRFDIEGNLINGPSPYSIKIKNEKK